MEITWHSVYKSPYPYEIATHNIYIEQPGIEPMCIGSLQVQHPHQWNKEEGRNEVEFNKIIFIACLFPANYIQEFQTASGAECGLRSAIKKFFAEFQERLDETVFPTLVVKQIYKH